MINCSYNVLTIDDDPTILDAYASILVPYKKTSLEDAVLKLEELHDIESSAIEPIEKSMNFEIFQANNGMSGIEIFLKKHLEGITIPVCIVDMRMPNGIDGLETALRLRDIDPDVHIIIATAYSDRTNKEILDSLKSNTYYIRKPFNNEEIYQLVYSLSLGYYATKTIQNLNNNLELKIEEELEKNRQKDLLLFEQAKLAAMGEMIGNIAHQWRQPLNIISMLFQRLNHICKHNPSDEKAVNTVFNQAMNTITHMSQTIDDFRGHFEPNREKIHYDLSSVIKSVAALLEPSFKLNGISIEIPSSLSPVRLYGFPEDLKQVLLNIVNNAKDAITINNIESGEISIKTELLHDDTEVFIQICDNGGGINEQYINKIFEPYFTTKHKSQGTGIGLYMSKRIIEERLNGTVNVSSSQKNTVFNILLPLLKANKD
jgi:signal transduction histidine kinase